MPTYVYLCEHCGTKLEKFHGINESPVLVCPRCSRKLVREISGGSGFLFRGPGFYATDYRSEGYKEAQRKEKDLEKPPGDTKKGEKSGDGAGED